LKELLDLSFERTDFLFGGAELVAKLKDASRHLLIDLDLEQCVFADSASELVDGELTFGRDCAVRRWRRGDCCARIG